MRFPNKNFVPTIKQMYPPGTRLKLIAMGEDPLPIPPGTRGTVSYVDDMGTIHMNWDNGRTLGLVPGEDYFRNLTQEEVQQEQLEAQEMGGGPCLTM